MSADSSTPKPPSPPTESAQARLQRIAQLLPNAKTLYDGNVRAPCPAHGGDGPNLSLTISDDGERITAKCWSQGCEWAAIADAIQRTTGIKLNPRLAASPSHPVPVAIYEHPDGRRKAAYRFDHDPIADPCENPKCDGKHCWQDKRSGPIAGFLLKLWAPGIPADNAGAVGVVIGEGEKTCAAIAAAGYTAAGWVAGAENADKANYYPVKDCHVVIWPDDDTAGRRAAAKAARKALSAGALSVRVIETAGETKEDAADFPIEERRRRITAALSLPEWTAAAAAANPADPAAAAAAEATAARDALFGIDKSTALAQQSLLSENTRRFFAVIGGELYIASPSVGEWRPVGDGRGRDVLAQAYALHTRNGFPPISASRMTDALVTANYVVADPKMYGLEVVDLGATCQEPLIPLKSGGMLDFRFREHLTPEESLGYWMRRGECYGVTWQPGAAAPDQWTDAARAVVAHYGESLFRRLAYLLLRPHKSIDVVNAVIGGWGKSTLAHWFQSAFAGYCQTIHTGRATSAQAIKFSGIEYYLTHCGLLFLDEADKADSKVMVTNFLNAFADDDMRVEQKGVDAITLPRRGNAVFLGGDWPHLTVGQGTEARFRWAKLVQDDAGEMPGGLRRWIETPDAAIWLVDYMANLAAEVYAVTEAIDATYDDAVGAAAAKQMLVDRADPKIAALMELYEPAPDGFVKTADIKAALVGDGLDVPPDKLFPKFIQGIFPRATAARASDASRARGYKGIREIQS